MDYARAHGISGITNVILVQNEGALAIHRRLGHDMAWDRDSGTYRVEHRFDAERAAEHAVERAVETRGAEVHAAGAREEAQST
jgi:hypothetical protein